jgi:hypothetical protein
MFKMELQWKEFNVDLAALDASLRADYPNYKGNQAYSILELWFDEEPSQEDKDAINALWAALDPDDAMVESYQSAAQIKAASDAKKESARAKLAALGLDADELKAILG